MSFDKPCYVLGAGGHAKTLLDALHSQGADIKGCVDPGQKIDFCALGNIQVLGDDSALETLDPNDVYLFNGIGSIGEPNVRKEIYKKHIKNGFIFPSIVHASAIVSPFAQIGSGCIIQAGSIIQAGTEIGDNVIINTQASIDHDCVIGDHTHIAPGATLCGAVGVGSSVHVGAGATVIQNINIGANAIIGAGAVIKRDVAPGEKVV